MQSDMALIAVFSYLFSSFVVYHVVAEKNHTVVTKVNINCRCKAVTGLKIVNIIWQPLAQKDSSILTNYRVLYESPITGKFQFGCTLNTTQHSLKKELHCSIIAKSYFDLRGFYFIVEIRNSFGVFISNKKTCRLTRALTSIQCTRPQNLTVKATGKRNISVSWQPAPFMGDQTPFLCYKIWYAAAQAKTNESMEITSKDSELQTFSDLYPYTEYTFFIQCSLTDCETGWGLVSGPVTGRTDEETPTEAPQFKNWSVSNIESEKRDVTVVWKLPPPKTWNGVPKKFTIDIWQVSSNENENGSSIPISNSSRNLQIDDGLATEATLHGLSRFMDYKTQISMCTAEGCGPTSVPLPFAGEKKPNKRQIYDPSESNFHWIVIGIVAGLVFLVLVFIVAVVYRHRINNQQRENQAPLQQRIQLDPVYGNMEDSSSSRRHSYEEIQLHDPEENLRACDAL